MPGTDGGEAGDLLLNITVTQNRDGSAGDGCLLDRPHSVLPRSSAVRRWFPPCAAMSCAGSQPGRSREPKIKLKGKGIVSMKNPSIHGNQYGATRSGSMSRTI